MGQQMLKDQHVVVFVRIHKRSLLRAVCVALLVERSLPTQVTRSSNPVIGKFYLLSTALKRRKWRKRGREWPNLKKSLFQISTYLCRLRSFSSVAFSIPKVGEAQAAAINIQIVWAINRSPAILFLRSNIFQRLDWVIFIQAPIVLPLMMVHFKYLCVYLLFEEAIQWLLCKWATFTQETRWDRQCKTF